jgi:subfamily B ATP-binding cassette protein MsbA
MALQARDVAGIDWTMKRLFPYLRYLRPVRWQFVAAVLFGILNGASSGLGIPGIMNYVLPKVFPKADATGIPPVPLTNTELLGLTLLIPLVFALRAASGFFNAYYINLCGVRVLESLRIDVFAKLQRLPLAFFQTAKSGDTISRVMADTNQLQMVITTVANDSIRKPATLICAMGAIVYKVWVDPKISFLLASLAIVPILVFPVRSIGKRLQKRALSAMTQMGSVTNILSENISAAREVRGFGLEEREKKRFADGVRNLFQMQLKVVKYNQMLSPLIEFITAFGVAFAFYYAYKAGVSLEQITVVLGALYFSYEPIKNIGQIHNEMQKGLSALERVEDVLNAPEPVGDPVAPVAFESVRGELDFRNVGFSYGGGVPALSEVSVHLPAGTICALVGPSGAGKSTFANLVPRFYDVSSGGFFVDGIDIRTVRVSDLRRKIAIVSQDPVLFNDSIAANIQLGRFDATRAEIEQAAKDAFAHEFIQRMPEGYDTLVGERGSRLSAGQKQRIAIARAFLRQAPILILDEATSALDAESEQIIREALTKLVRGKTVLIIAHRFTTIRDAHKILVFENGRVVANGNHASLYGTDPMYTKLYDQQR